MLALAVDAGFILDRYTGSGHYKLHHPQGGTLIIPSTPGGSRWKKNIIADIRRQSGRKDHS